MSHYNKEMVSVYTNTSCNLDCRYCYTNKKDYPPQSIDIEFAKRLIIDYFTKPEYQGFKPVIRFFAAGEPTMNIQAIKTLVAFTRQSFGNQVEFELQTNGIFVQTNGDYDLELAKWVAENIDYIWISCDGTPDIQDSYRPLFPKAFSSPPALKSHEIVEKTINKILPICKKMVGVRMTIVEANLYRQCEMIDYFYKLGMRDIWADPLFPSVGETKAIEEIDLKIFAREFLKACDYAASFGVDSNDINYDKVIYGSNYTCNFDEETKHYCRACKPVPHATTDGFITACDMAMFKTDEDDISACMNSLIFGKWNKDEQSIEYYSDVIDALRARNCEEIRHCRTCIAKLHCGGYCLGEVTNETGRIDGRLPEKCRALRYIFKHMNDRQRKYRYSHP